MSNRWLTRPGRRGNSKNGFTDPCSQTGANVPGSLDDLGDDVLIAHPVSVDAFVVLYRRYAGPILSYCRMRIGNPQDAEDVAAQVFANAYGAFPPDDRSTFRAWLFTIAHHAVVSHYRRQRGPGRTRPLTDTELANVPDPSSSPELAAIRDDDFRDLRLALHHLNDDQRRVVELRLAGLKGAEIAGVISRSESAVKMLQFRAMKRLRTVLGPPIANAETSTPKGKDLADAH